MAVEKLGLVANDCCDGKLNTLRGEKDVGALNDVASGDSKAASRANDERSGVTSGSFLFHFFERTLFIDRSIDLRERYVSVDRRRVPLCISHFLSIFGASC